MPPPPKWSKKEDFPYLVGVHTLEALDYTKKEMLECARCCVTSNAASCSLDALLLGGAHIQQRT